METAHRSRKFPRIIAAALLSAALIPVLPLRADQLPLIPRLAFYGGAEKSNFRVSPDGIRLAYLGPSGKGGPGLWIRTPGKNDDRLVTGNPAALGGFRWAFDNRHLLFLRDSGQGRENFTSLPWTRKRAESAISLLSRASRPRTCFFSRAGRTKS